MSVKLEEMIIGKLKYFQINKVVIWGHKLHNSTHSYIHGAWVKTFKYLNMEVLWLDNEDNINNINFDNCLFFTEGNVDGKIPINLNSYYILHNCWDFGGKYKNLIQEKRVIVIQKFENIVRNNDYHIFNNLKLHYYHKNNIILSLPWATDLIPNEIDENIDSFHLNNLEKKAIFVGSRWKDENHWAIDNTKIVDDFRYQCQKKNIKYKHYSQISYKENKELVSNSLYCHSLQMEWQVIHGYIPCRILKNISYGGIPITNNEEVYKLLNEKPLLLKNTQNIIEDIDEYISDKNNEYFKDIMKDVRDNHTYINRINAYLDFLKYINDNNIDKPDLSKIYQETCCHPINKSCLCGKTDIQKIYNKYLNRAMFHHYSESLFKSVYGRVPHMRDFTFSYCLDFLKEKDNANILELGTSRSFVDGKYPGCLEDNIKYFEFYNLHKWDWSAGIFTKYFSKILKSEGKNFKITTVDLSPKSISICKKITYDERENINYVCNSSENVIKKTPSKSVDLLYVDTGDMDEFTAELHKREAILIVKHDILKDDGIILIDDVRNPCNDFSQKI